MILPTGRKNESVESVEFVELVELNSTSLPVQHNSGFTLLEILVTVTIVSATLAIILGAFNLSLRASNVTNSYLRANLLLDSKMSELEYNAQTQGLETGEAAVEFAEGFDGSQNVVLVNAEEKDPRLMSVTLNISWPKGEKSLSTYVYNEKEQEPQKE